MKNNKTIIAVIILILILGSVAYLFYSHNKNTPPVNSDTASSTSITYNNADYGFNFSLPANWQGYTVVKEVWKGTALESTTAQSGSKLLIRNPKWTTAAPYEDLPILVFTIPQWDAYQAESFSVSAAPIKASELARNNRYVFALPPRWDFDYSLDFKEAEDIFAGNPLHPFNVEVVNVKQGKLNINLVCEQTITYMRFTDAKSAATYVADCKEGKHPEVIEKYKASMNLGDGATI